MTLHDLAAPPEVTEEPLLSVRDLQVEFSSSSGRVHAVNGVTFDVQAHETLGVVGESGCGKSVTALAILGLLAKPAGKVAGGQVIFDGVELLDLDPDDLRDLRGRRISMIFQDPMTSLNPVITIEEQLVEVIFAHEKIRRDAAHKRAVGLLEMVGIPNPERSLAGYAHQLSGRHAPARHDRDRARPPAELIIADEPTTALDVTIQAQILELIRRVASETGAAVMLITHDLGVVAGMTERIQVMYAGPHRRDGHDRGAVRAPPPPVHRGPAQVDPAARRVGGPRAHPDRGAAARSHPPADGLLLRAALRLGDRALPRPMTRSSRRSARASAS